jgi:WD repeat and SOF domain-containing protein 1
MLILDMIQIFETLQQNSAAPQALGFNGFFKGNISPSSLAHLTLSFIHNRWKPFDPSRNWPDLGQQFIVSERAARLVLAKEGDEDVLEREGRDKWDLDWVIVPTGAFSSTMAVGLAHSLKTAGPGEDGRWPMFWSG